VPDRGLLILARTRPLLGKGDTTDKGYINQRGVLAAR
jgi:hypothetical protein